MRFINNIIHIIRKLDKVTEGGIARDRAFYNYLHDKDNVKSIIFARKNPFHIIYLLWILYFFKDKIFLLHQSSIFVPFSDAHFIGKIGRKIYIRLLKKVIKKNQIIFEINDLPIEQAKDLELEVPYYFKEIEEAMFNLKDAQYIFASYSMRDYIVNKYNVPFDNTFVCINGGIKKNQSSRRKQLDILKDEKIKFVYAGTLNKGRQIEDMIDIFRGIETVNLILLGKNGEWIENKEQAENIMYLGELEENEAQQVVSQCDIGVIPYDASRLYYNIAFPTKEIRNFMRSYKNIGIIKGISEWKKIIADLKRCEIELMKEEVEKIKEDFYWETIINNLFIEIKCNLSDY